MFWTEEFRQPVSDDKVRVIRFVDTDDNFIDNMEEKETTFTEAF